jgi:hypothetical protein
VTHLKLALLVAAGLVTSAAINFAVGIAWGVWSVAESPPSIVVRYVDRAGPTPSAAATTPRARPSVR